MARFLGNLPYMARWLEFKSSNASIVPPAFRIFGPPLLRMLLRPPGRRYARHPGILRMTSSESFRMQTCWL